jgi:hypothetical protein
VSVGRFASGKGYRILQSPAAGATQACKICTQMVQERAATIAMPPRYFHGSKQAIINPLLASWSSGRIPRLVPFLLFLGLAAVHALRQPA